MELRRDVFQAIADPTRRTILLLLAVNSMTAGAISAKFESARPTISKHMRILTECDLVTKEQHGREIFFNLNPQKLKDIDQFIEPFRQLWDDRFNKLETVMKNYKNKGLE